MSGKDTSSTTLSLKRQAAVYAVDTFVHSGMILGLGSGTTALEAVRYIAECLQSGKLSNIVGVPCSIWIEEHAIDAGVPLTTLDENPRVDLTIDGADEVDPHLDLIKGGGASLLREKIVAQATAHEVIIVDESKISEGLGIRFPLPVEVIPFGWTTQDTFLRSLGAQTSMRLTPEGQPHITNQGNYIIDCAFGQIPDPYALAEQLQSRAGIVEHGLFLGIARDVIVAGSEGVRHLKRP
ncbi:MAG TPA: ribose 5-phosphate isomerase A [Aggregatilinea sp.]|uniref:ribose 5-phosphate isomerase A n=1 Tax=Aggregatilinea sp. TaxID=2806333 RepID=UPI002C9303CE|nr:ribose 5-phosphate isomerase A [Aggregatilinea sp.]HML22541.1 ribose 5-phosphate isomerase A [Aggregatilinea sp.]